MNKKFFKVWLFSERGKSKHFAMAHALETDTVASGDDHVDAIRNLRISLRMEIDHMKQTGVNQWHRAPQQCWDRAKEDGVLVTMDL